MKKKDSIIKGIVNSVLPVILAFAFGAIVIAATIKTITIKPASIFFDIFFIFLPYSFLIIHNYCSIIRNIIVNPFCIVNL